MQLPFLLLILIYSVLGTCPTGTIYEDLFKKCYKYEKTPASFLIAEKSCEKFGGNLVSLANTYENLYVSKIVGESDPFVSSFWIGASFLISLSWAFTDGSNSTYTNFAPGQPTDPSMYQCAAVRQPDACWTKELCGTNKPFVCEISPNATASQNNCTSKCDNSMCDPGYSLFVGTCQCYKAMTEQLAYTDAYNGCGSGHLAYIHSAELNTFIVNLMSHAGITSSPPWIGLRCPSSDKTLCRWGDNSLMDYNNFAANEPNGEVSTVYICSNDAIPNCFAGGWSTPNYPNGKGPYICQRPSYPAVQVSELVRGIKSERIFIEKTSDSSTKVL